MSKSLVKRNCQKCGREFTVKRSIINQGKGKHCSTVCAGQAKVSKIDLCNDLRRVAHLLGHRPSISEYEEMGKYSREVIRRHGGLKNVWESMGLVFKVKYVPIGGAPVAKDDLLADLQRVHKEIGHPPSTREYVKHGQHSIGTALKVLGAAHWYEVLIKSLSLSKTEIAYLTPPSKRTFEMWIVLLQSLYAELKRTPTSQEAQDKFCLRVGLYPVLQGKTFEMLLQKAGIKPRQGAKSSSLHWLRRRNAQAAKPLSDVPDSVRNMLKESSIQSIQEFFKGR